ncbi:MAG: hypothetical protein GX810_08965, partial [Clostridiales bacterium]|nr:hypothetical protein [Clostridiales bacterium]
MMEFQEQLRLLTQRKTAADGGVQAQVPEGTARLGGTLFDAGSFVEIGALQAEANCLTGHGLVNGRPADLIAQDPEASGGAMGQAQAAKMVRALDMAERACAPVVFLLNSQGAKVLEGAQVLGAYADVFTRMSALSGVCPMLAVVNGPCVGAAAHFVGLADIAIAVEKSAVVLPASASVLHAVHG